MFDLAFIRTAVAAAVLTAGTFLAPAHAQTVGTRIPVGANPVSVAVNPVTNKLYIANANANTVSAINLNTGSGVFIPVGAYPAWVAINVETNTIYASTLTGANTAVISGATDTVVATTASGGGGWTAVNPLVDTAYVLRYGGSDEVNVIQGSVYTGTSATRSRQPVSLAVNPVNNWLYVAHQTTGDVVAMDMTASITTFDPYPQLKCPDGSGGFRAQPPIPPPGSPDTWNTPCIDVPGTVIAVAVNPVTNKIYALSTNATNQISVINGTNSTFTSLTPPGSLGTAKTIAVNPITNKIYAAFATAVVVIDGATNAMTVISTGTVGGGPAAIGINVLTNMIYVPNADGTMLVINGTSGTSSLLAIPASANAIAVNPITNTLFILDSAGGVTPVTGAAGTATATGISTTITPLAGNAGGTSGSISMNASSTMAPAPLGTIRRVYYRIGSTGPWSRATGTGTGPYSAYYSGLTPGSYTIQAFATNSLESPSINTDLANVPIVGNVTSYTFTVSPTIFALGVTKAGGGTGTVTSSPPGINCGATCSANYDAGTPVSLTATPAGDSIFGGWSGDCAGSSTTCQVSMSAARNVTATFNLTTSIPRLAGISTRAQVLTGDNVMIGGFIIGGSTAKKVVIRARGPSLGLAGALADPTLTLVPSSGPAITNDDWQSAANAVELSASGFAPGNPKESAILVTLDPGAYTAIVSGVGNTTGLAIVEVFEIDHPEIPLAGISTRGRVTSGDNVVIGGFIIQGDAPQRVVVRARGPSLGVAGALADPVITLVPSSGPAIVNDDWQTASNAADLTTSGFAPSNPKESAILITLQPGAYTAIVSGAGGSTGVGIVEIFNVP